MKRPRPLRLPVTSVTGLSTETCFREALVDVLRERAEALERARPARHRLVARERDLEVGQILDLLFDEDDEADQTHRVETAVAEQRALFGALQSRRGGDGSLGLVDGRKEDLGEHVHALRSSS